LQIEGQLISFYREDTGDKLLIPEELAQALKEERLAREQAQEQARQAQSQVEKLKEQLRSFGVNPDTI
jgi:ABC-type Fe3+-hydroxamate transport system substrate-binding protein